jgi:hypothetical protein
MTAADETFLKSFMSIQLAVVLEIPRFLVSRYSLIETCIVCRYALSLAGRDVRRVVYIYILF